MAKTRKFPYLCAQNNEGMADYIAELNESQREAVTYCDGPALVIAGAGSGKTRVLTYKIAYLLEHGYYPWQIMALTFTNKAAREMKERIMRQIGETGAAGLWMGTFHSLFSRILRIEADAIGFTPDFTIYDAADQKSLLKSIIKEMELDDKTYKPGTVAGHISNAKNRLILPGAYAADPGIREADRAARLPALADIYRRYVQRCKQAGAMDFDDLLLYTWLLFEQHPEIRQKYADKFRYVLVDEYQDTNVAQHRIVWQLTEQHRRVCVVGDDAQSIYSFRGARIDNILQFTSQYAEARTFKLERNYRSTKIIVQAANSLIDKNSRQIRKEVFSENEEGERIPVFAAYSDMEEAEMVAGKIREVHRRAGVPYEGFAVLYRTNAQSRTFEEIFRKRGLPYRIYGGLSFYQRKEIKDIIAYFRLTVNPHDEEAFKRIINYPARGIGNTTVSKIVEAANGTGVSLWSVLTDPLGCGLNVNKGTHAKLQGFRELIDAFREHLDQDACEIGQLIVRESGILKEIHADATPENISRQENVQELMNGLHDFVDIRRQEGSEELSLRDFLSEVSLLSDVDTDDGDSEEKITLMTVHSAKGLEFDTVFVVGLEQDLFPSAMASNSLSGLEEERRLLYVAVTRAENRCFLSFARSRFRFGKTEMCTPSPFLRDFDPRWVEMEQPASFRPAERPVTVRRPVVDAPLRTFRRVELSVPSAPSPAPASSAGTVSPSGLRAGSRIEHERFGWGEVIRVEGSGENCKATVRFRHAGEKQLLLKFARFKIIE